MSHVFHRFPSGMPPVAFAGDGIFIVDRDGKQYIDASGGAAVSCLGHSNARVRNAIIEQSKRLAFAHTSFFTSEPAEALADFLISKAPSNLTKVHYVSGGSEAVETALKLARQYFVAKGELKRGVIISRERSYHGATLGAVAISGNAWRRAPFEPLLFKSVQIEACYSYRGKREDETEREYGLRVANQLEREILQREPGTVAAFVAETVVGATAGALAPVEGYFKRLREICDQHGVLLILDEVMSGMGRTGSLFAFEQEGISPDIVTIAKGMGAGYQPIGAAICTQEIYDTINRDGGFAHGHTYLGHAIACAAALEVQRVIEDENLLENVRSMGNYLHERLVDRFGSHPNVGDIRGRGLFRAIELVADRETKEPFPAARKLHSVIKKNAMERGLMVYPTGGVADGKAGDHVLLAPPYIVTRNDVETIVDRLESAVSAALLG
ncbi:aspartate aminotransferase family protein [Sinorhizobium meliloti]|uniref:aspartate aminotransferase family protein n=1 Tax=Rhizobium meliloti TaxID=382 RepID=UPI003D659F4C